MPGSIQVSVLDFKELPSSSNSVKVSLGKVEHEALEKETYSFPLTNLRDDLVISIQDSEGKQLSQSGVRTMSVIEKGTWDDLFPVEGGGVIHMKLQFILNDEERNRIRLMRESAMKKKEAEILAKSCASSLRRHEVSDVLRATTQQDFQTSGFDIDAATDVPETPLDKISTKSSVSSDVIKEESFLRQSFTNATDRMGDTSFLHLTENINQNTMIDDTVSQNSPTYLSKKKEAATPNASLVENLYDQNLEEKISSDTKSTSEENASLLHENEVNLNNNNGTPSQQIEVPEKLLEDIKTEDFVKTDAMEPKLSGNVDEKLDNLKFDEKISSFVKKMSKESKLPPFSPETKVNTNMNNETQLHQIDVPKRLQDASSCDVSSSRSAFAEKVKSFFPSSAGEPDKRSSLDKIPRNITKMISVFESSTSQDRVPFKSLSTKSYKVGTLRLIKENEVKDYNLNSSEILSSTRLRNSFSTDDLRKNLSSIVSKEEQINFDNAFVEPSETTQSKENHQKETEKLPNEGKVDVFETDTKKLPTSCEEDAVASGIQPPDDIKYTEKNGINAQGEKAVTLLRDCKIPEIVVRGDGNVRQGEEMVRVSENSSPKSADAEASNGSLGQAIKIALVVGFGVLVLLFRQREPGRDKKNINTRVLKNQVFMNKRGSTEEQRSRIGVTRSS